MSLYTLGFFTGDPKKTSISVHITVYPDYHSDWVKVSQRPHSVRGGRGRVPCFAAPSVSGSWQRGFGRPRVGACKADPVCVPYLQQSAPCWFSVTRRAPALLALSS